ncbi:MAG: response regulator [Candidatus Methylomirabilia bacterium]
MSKPSVHGGSEGGESDGQGDSIRSVLIIEDSPVYLRILSRHLESLGCRVVESAGVESALCLLVHERPDLILTDLLMPGLDGLDLVTILQGRADWRGIPVVVHSKANTQDLVQVMMRFGVRDYILKPFNPETAIPRLTKILASLPPRDSGRSLARRAKAQGRVPVLLVTQRAEFATLVRHEANPLYDVILVESGPAALAAAIELSPWMIFVTPEIATWDMARTMIKLRAVKTLARIPITPLLDFDLAPVQAKLNPPFAITRDLPRTTVTLRETFTQSWLDALWVALHEIVGSETEELVFEGPSTEAGHLIEAAWIREFAQSLGVRAFRKVKDRYISVSDR